MDTRFNKSKPQTRAAYRAKFALMIVRVLGERKVLKCELDMEVRPLSRRSDIYGIWYVSTNRRVGANGYCLRDAKAACEAMFVEKLQDWHEVGICFAR